MKNINPTHTESWKSLQQHFLKIKNVHISDLFKQDKNRFSHFSRIFNNLILIDYSKNLITQETINKLINLAKECNLTEAIEDMFQGKKINHTEKRAVLHTALRNRYNLPIIVDGSNIMLKINKTLKKMKTFSQNVIQGHWKGYTNKKITDVVSIGIGGSNLGPHMVTEALKPYKNHLNIHFVSNIDGTHILETLKKLNPETTLFLIISKTFTTTETITNAYTAKHWFINKTLKSNNIKNISKHFIAVSSNSKEINKFGINTSENIFQISNWIGGRYSLWSAVGLPIILSIGFNNFELLLNGAHAMDLHFRNTTLEQNIPVILALIGIWYNNFFLAETEAILPYDQYMHRFAAYLQQSNMESNGKNVNRNGYPINYQTGPIIWGEPGTNGQHAFYQLMHQGTKMIPCDFIAPTISHNSIFDHHEKLIANFLAQTKALAFGKNINEIQQEYNRIGKKSINYQNLIPFKIFKGNQPSNSIFIKQITPYTLGSLIALYEHKIFTQGVIFNIYPFDQWGVELGKTLANNIYSELQHNYITTNYDSSTNGLINFFKSYKNT